VLARYRKSHLWAAENDIFDPGPEAGVVVDTPVGRIGVAICYDNEFPEVPRRLALAGAEVLALPVNWPLVPRPAGEHPPETIQAMAAARSSRMAIVIADRHGSERGVEWTGGTAVVSSDGWICATADEPGQIASAALDLPAPGDKSLGAYNDLFADRRPDLYRPVHQPLSPTLTEK
jgi:predicted amidohydrolase